MPSSTTTPPPLQLTILAGTLPSGAVYNAQTYFNAIVDRMRATVSGGNVIWGQLGGTQPSSALPGSDGQAGLWFGDPDGGFGYWNDWNSDAQMYLPARLLCGQYINAKLFTTDIVCGAITADQTIITPDESGTIALTKDLLQQRGSQTFFGGPGIFLIDWNNRAPVHITMTGDATLDFENYDNGETMDFWLENGTGSGTFHVTVTNGYFDGAAAISSPQALSIGVAGKRVIDHVRVFIEAGYIFAQIVAKNYQIAIGADTAVATPLSATSPDGINIGIQMSNILMGGTLLASDFTVRVGGTVNPISGTPSCSGQTVTVSVTNHMPLSAAVTIQYTGTDMKSIGGIAVAAFGPITVEMTSGNGGGGIGNHRGGTPPGGHGGIQ